MENSAKDEEQEPLMEVYESQATRKNRHFYRFATIANVLLFSITMAMFILSQRQVCTSENLTDSPVLRHISRPNRQTWINGTFYPTEDPSWSRREPGDTEAERIWTEFEDIRPLPITRQDVIALGKDPETVARFPDEVFGLGPEAYIAALDVQHKMHCLNELRKMAFAQYKPETHNQVNYTRTWWVHLRHCVDMLAQDLLCHADGDLYTYRWMDTQSHPFPDFSISRQCRTVDELFKYRDGHAVDVHKYDRMTKPKTGIANMPMEPSYYAEYGFAHSELYKDGQGYEGNLPDHSDWFGLPPPRDTKDSLLGH